MVKMFFNNVLWEMYISMSIGTSALLKITKPPLGLNLCHFRPYVKGAVNEVTVDI